MPTSDWLGSAISGVSGLLTTAISANQIKQNAKGVANDIKAQNAGALAVAQEQTKQAELAYQAALASKASGNSNKTLYILLAVSGVLMLGTIIFVVTRKK